MLKDFIFIRTSVSSYRDALLSITFICCVLTTRGAEAQQASSIAQAGTSVPGSYQPNGVDTINLQNGALILDIPIVSYPQLGDKLKLSFSLKYSPIFWLYSAGPPAVNSNGVEEYTGTWSDPNANTYTPIGVTLVRDQALEETTVPLSYPCSSYTAPSSCPTPQNGSQVAEEEITANLSSLITSDGGVHNYGLNGNNGDYTFVPTMDGTNFVPVPNGSQTPTIFLGMSGVTYSQVEYSSSPVLYAFNQTDPDGNAITVSSAGWKDTIGRLIPGSISGPGSGQTSLYTGAEPFPGAVTTDLSQCSSGATAARIWSIPGPNGGTSTYTLCFTPYTAETAFATSNSQSALGSIYVTENGGQASGSYLLLTQLILPNSTSYQFTYDSWLELTSISLPSGGSISYGWITEDWPTADIAHQQTRRVNTRTEHNTDGTSHTWTYSLSEASIAQPPVPYATMIVTDPNQNDEEHDFIIQSTNGVLTGNKIEAISSYSGTGSSRTLLKTTTLVSAQMSIPLIFPASGPGSFERIGGPLLSKTVEWAGSSQVSQTTYVITPPTGTYTYYDFNENTASALGVHAFAAQTCTSCWSTFQTQAASEYDYGNGQPGTLLHTTTTTYKWNDGSSTAASYLAANILDIPSKVTITGSGGNTGETDYAYDETSYSPGGTRGHPTTVTRVNTSGPSISSHSHINSVGMVSSTVDTIGNITAITYDNTGIYPSKVQQPIANGVVHVDYYSFDSNTGNPEWHTDQNGTGANDPSHTITYSYDNMGRPTSISYPGGGATSLCYSDEGGPICTQSSAPFSVYSSTLASPDPSQLSHASYDGFGRQTQITLANGATTETTYDPLGRVASMSNPHIASSSNTDGYTTYAYDALGRLRYKCNPDNGTGSGACVPGTSYLQQSYSGNSINFADEKGN